MTTKGKMKPTFKVSLTASQAGENSQTWNNATNIKSYSEIFRRLLRYTPSLPKNLSALRRLVQMRHRDFVTQCCKQNAIFSDTSHPSRSFLDNMSTNQWYIFDFLQDRCSRFVTDKNSKHLQILQAPTPDFHSNSAKSPLRNGNCILPEWQNLKWSGSF